MPSSDMKIHSLLRNAISNVQPKLFSGPQPGSDAMRALLYQLGSYGHLKSVELFSRQILPCERLKHFPNVILDAATWQNVLHFGEVIGARCLLLSLLLSSAILSNPTGTEDKGSINSIVTIYAAKLCIRHAKKQNY